MSKPQDQSIQEKPPVLPPNPPLVAPGPGPDGSPLPGGAPAPVPPNVGPLQQQAGGGEPDTPIETPPSAEKPDDDTRGRSGESIVHPDREKGDNPDDETARKAPTRE